MKQWTEAQLAHLPIPEAGKRTLSLGRGLHLITYSTGRRSFGRVEKNAAGHPALKPFAAVKVPGCTEPTAMTILEARAWLATHALAREQSRAHELEQATRDKATITFSKVIADVLELIEGRNDIQQDRKNRYRNTLENTFAKRPIPEVGGTWGELELAHFTGGRWLDRYDKTLHAIERTAKTLGDKRGPSTLGNEVDVFMRKVFKHAVRHGYMEAQHVPERNAEVNRPRSIERMLTIPEIEHLLNVTSREAVAKNDELNEFDACFLRVLLFAGIRLNSVRLAKRSHMHLHTKDFWTFPAEALKKTKKQRAKPRDHHVPLTDALRLELARLEEQLPVGCDPFFPERYHLRRDPTQCKPRSASWAKHRLEDHAELLHNTGPNAYSAHAFRRTQSNMMRELGLPDHVIDLAQARVPRDTAKTYLTAELRDQIVNAFELYHDFLEACMHGHGEAYMERIRARRRAQYLKVRAEIRKEIGLETFTAVKGGKR